VLDCVAYVVVKEG